MDWERKKDQMNKNDTYIYCRNIKIDGIIVLFFYHVYLIVIYIITKSSITLLKTTFSLMMEIPGNSIDDRKQNVLIMVVIRFFTKDMSKESVLQLQYNYLGLY